MIDTYLSYRDSTSSVLDTSCVTHVFNDFQRLTSKRKLPKGEVKLRMGKGARVVAIALGSVNLKLPSGYFLSLEECYDIPCIVKNIILMSCLDKMGYAFDFYEQMLTFKKKC